MASTPRPSAAARSREVTTTAAAPSEIWEALPAVMVPSGENAGRSRPRASAVVPGRMPSSWSTVTSPLRWAITTGTISSPRTPFLVASAARSWERADHSSWAARSIPRRWLTWSERSPMWASSKASQSPSWTMASTSSASPMRAPNRALGSR